MDKLTKQHYDELKEIFNRYHIKEQEARYIWKNIKPIFCHQEFQRRLDDPFFHHENITVGEHILKDTIFSYKLAKAKKISSEEIKRTILIAMFHDLYVMPWMDNTIKNQFKNQHAFRHPVEAIVNAIAWFPEYFTDLEQAKIIIDGVLHHMYPCPVVSSKSLDWELNNKSLYDNLDEKYKNLIICSLNPCVFKNYSLRKTFYIEGRILSRVDKIVTFRNDLKVTEYVRALKRVVAPPKQ